MLFFNRVAGVRSSLLEGAGVRSSLLDGASVRSSLLERAVCAPLF